jgi:hypothetical protein
MFISLFYYPFLQIEIGTDPKSLLRGDQISTLTDLVYLNALIRALRSTSTQCFEIILPSPRIVFLINPPRYVFWHSKIW